jgi:hypothetical protein
MRRVGRAGLLSALTLVLVGSALRRAIRSWGATPEEVAGVLPGDDLVATPDLRLTRAITIGAPAEGVFAWLAQLGQGRGGFYSYDWLENRTGLDVHSADVILPQFQDLKRGDRVPVAPGPTFYGFVVADVVHPSHLVLQMLMHPFTGRPVDPPGSEAAWSIHATWAFALTPIDRASTRLVSRTRVKLRLPVGLRHVYALALEAVELPMQRRMLLGIRERAERREREPNARSSGDAPLVSRGG